MNFIRRNKNSGNQVFRTMNDDFIAHIRFRTDWFKNKIFILDSLNY
jgi:hypothetical protein